MRLLLRFYGFRNAAVGGADSERWICSPPSSLSSKKLGFRCIVTSCRAVLLPRFGGPEVLELRDDVGVPDLKPNEVLVSARAVSVNPLDTIVLSYNGLHPPDSLAVTAAGIAVALSEVPHSKVIAGVRIGLVNDKFIVNPTTKEMEDSKLDLLLAGTDSAILMIEETNQVRWIWEFEGDNYPIDGIDEHVISEPFEPSPFMPAVTEAFDNDFNVIISRQGRGQTDTDALVGLLSEKETSTRENNVAKIKVVVRKRPLNKKETARKEEDIVTV